MTFIKIFNMTLVEMLENLEGCEDSYSDMQGLPLYDIVKYQAGQSRRAEIVSNAFNWNMHNYLNASCKQAGSGLGARLAEESVDERMTCVIWTGLFDNYARQVKAGSSAMHLIVVFEMELISDLYNQLEPIMHRSLHAEFGPATSGDGWE